MQHTGFQIPTRPEGQRVWVVRASSGQFVEHFRRHGLVAVGHVDGLQRPPGQLDLASLDSLEAQLIAAEPTRSRASAASHANQVRAVVGEIKDGDLVVTLDSDLLTVGVVQGPAYIAHSPIMIARRSGRSHQMPFHLRRPVTWGPVLKRDDVPFALEMTLLAHQTVFNLDSHWDTVYHLVYPYFRYQDHLYFSTNIKQTAALDNYSIAQIFGLLSGVEAVSKCFDENASSLDRSYLEIISAWGAAGDLTLTSKAEFMSPGAIWSKMKANPKGMAWAALVYAMLFGAKTPVIETDGVFDREMREKAMQIVVEMTEHHQLDKAKSKLGVGVPDHNTTELDKHALKQSSKSHGTGQRHG